MFFTVLHTIEFQKRGLPHAQIIFWVSNETSQSSVESIDSLITTEIPDPEIDPLGYILVAEHMIHGPCEDYNKNAPCMKDVRCTKKFPKKSKKKLPLMEMGLFSIDEEILVDMSLNQASDLIINMLYLQIYCC
jgi:hypothetical protein